jgi:hypothetical protein
MDCVILDIDGCLANNDHRLHHIRTSPKDYESFYSAMVDDTPISDIIWLVDLIITAQYEQEDFVLFVCTGRPEDYREETEAWLSTYAPRLHNCMYEISMRPSGDHRENSVVKNEMIESIKQQGFNIRLVLEDNPNVITMLQENNITVMNPCTYNAK